MWSWQEGEQQEEHAKQPADGMRPITPRPSQIVSRGAASANQQTDN